MSYEEISSKFGVKLKYLRLLKNMTQEELAEKLSVDPHYLSDIECGRRNITLKTICKISDALHVGIEQLFIF
ncbi:TPA: helix-turn-helix transcriptional regulator [Candidatus Scatousia excrementigallinarum]|uniref:Helix-turn-helix transcriptional regulator n=1 Tax=Candidatus Scatousia excrementigallinarum TaxID=2840935 RepID=A0A9D1F1V4_9BACT|nr:helix-turn-helix transcriptional regulator [Candidatus Scatousia excrementigallinarum]